MLLTVTPNTALDKVLFVDHFAFGETVRASDVADGMGGKGAVTSWVLGQLGTPSLATGFAAGETGQRMKAVLVAAGVLTDFVWVAGETRTNYVLARPADGVQGTITAAGYAVTAEDVRALTERVLRYIREDARVEALLCGGSLPKGMPVDSYVPLIQAAKARGILTLLDTSDQFLAPNLVALPDIIKPNAAEASHLLGRRIQTATEAAEAVRELRARGISTPVITLGAEGAVAGTDEGVYYVPPVQVRVINTAGAGDGFNAGLLRARLQGDDWAEALRWAGAVATSILLTPGTGACRPEDAERLYPQVHVERLI
jgi:1-phosphofructokinase family hexose kinase